MLTVEKVMVLTGVDIFNDVPTALLASFASVFDEVEFVDGDEVIRQGDLGDRLFVVVEGALRIEVDNRSIGEKGPGSVVGELAVLDPEPRAASAVAVGDTLLMCLDKDHFDLFITDHPQLSGSVIRYLVRFIRASTRRDVPAET